MKELIKEEKKDTPGIDFNAETGILKISGYSYPENVKSFYNEVFDWLDNYIKEPNSKTVLEATIVYFNMASSKILMELFKKLEAIPSTDLEFNWRYEDDDFEMELAGEEFASLLKYEVNLVKS
jgi:hypothetical protein